MKTFITSIFMLFTIITMAQQHQERPSVDVTGEGIAYITPDQVTINVRVENTGRDPKSVKQENDRIVSQVFSAIKKLNIDDKDVKTDYIRLNKNYEFNTKSYNYAANQSIAIRLKDLSKYENLMNALLESGINRIDGVAFGAENEDALKEEARVKAMQNAKAKAQTYAGVLSQEIGKALKISEFQQTNSPQPMYRAMAMDSEMAGGQQTIAPGEMEISVRVNVSFELL